MGKDNVPSLFALCTVRATKPELIFPHLAFFHPKWSIVPVSIAKSMKPFASNKMPPFSHELIRRESRPRLRKKGKPDCFRIPRPVRLLEEVERVEMFRKRSQPVWEPCKDEAEYPFFFDVWLDDLDNLDVWFGRVAFPQGEWMFRIECGPHYPEEMPRLIFLSKKDDRIRVLDNGLVNPLWLPCLCWWKESYTLLTLMHSISNMCKFNGILE